MGAYLPALILAGWAGLCSLGVGGALIGAVAVLLAVALLAHGEHGKLRRRRARRR